MKLICKLIIAGCLASIVYHTWLVAYWIQQYHVQIDNNLDLKMAIDEDIAYFLDPGSIRSIRIKNKATGAKMSVVYCADLDTIKFFVQDIIVNNRPVKTLAVFDEWKGVANIYDYNTLKLMPGTENILELETFSETPVYTNMLDQLKKPVLVYDYHKEFLPHKSFK